MKVCTEQRSTTVKQDTLWYHSRRRKVTGLEFKPRRKGKWTDRTKRGFYVDDDHRQFRSTETQDMVQLKRTLLRLDNKKRRRVSTKLLRDHENFLTGSKNLEG